MGKTRNVRKAWTLSMAAASVIVASPAWGQALAARGSSVYAIRDMTPTGGRDIIALPSGAPMSLPLPNAERPMGLALDTKDRLWVITPAGHIYRLGVGDDPKKPGRLGWGQQAGSASDISVGPDGSLYSVAFGAPGDKPIQKWNGSVWNPISQAAGVRVIGNQCGLPELINVANQHLRLDLTGTRLWEPTTSKIAVREMTIGGAGTFALGTTPVASKVGDLYPVMKWTSQIQSTAAGPEPVWDWYETTLLATSIAVNDETGTLWYSDNRGFGSSVALGSIVLKANVKGARL